MNNVNKTLYIPLYGKALVSRRGILLRDKKAEEIWEAEGFALKGKSKSKWLAFYLAMRAKVYDEWVTMQCEANPDAIVLQIGCGLDSRITRVDIENTWFDLDFASVIAERRRYFEESDRYRMIEGDLREDAWLSEIPKNRPLIVLLEGVSMYVKPEELRACLKKCEEHASKCTVLLDYYTAFAAKASKVKNPINDVGVSEVYGLDDPAILIEDTNLRIVQMHNITPPQYCDELKKSEKALFSALYGGKIADKMYRMVELEGVSV